MSQKMQIGLGGGCHWCTEAIFLSLNGVGEVKQGWIASEPPFETLSEAVLVAFNPQIISLPDLIGIHLLTHSADSPHSKRNKYRSAVYYLEKAIKREIESALNIHQHDFDKPLVTKVLPFCEFKPSLPDHQNYYYNNPEKPFCKTYIEPKLKSLREKYGRLSKPVIKALIPLKKKLIVDDQNDTLLYS